MSEERFVGRSATTYTPGVDAVAMVAVVLTVECHPKHAETVLDFLRGVKDQQGVYAAVMQVVGAEKPHVEEEVPAPTEKETPPELRPGYIVPVVEEPSEKPAKEKKAKEPKKAKLKSKRKR
jgi:outer membrane biosynthesis protein TonB